MLTLQEAIDMGRWIESAIWHYTDGDVQPSVLAEPMRDPDKSNPDLIWASSISHRKCPKRVAADRVALVDPDFTDEQLYLFALAKYAAMMAKVALKTGLETAQEGQAFMWSGLSEVEVKDEQMSGRIDFLMSNTLGDKLPVEIKFTDCDQYLGLMPDHVWQTIAYMTMLGTHYGYVLTLYPKNGFRVWLVARRDDGWAVMSGIMPIKFVGDNGMFPTDDLGNNFFSEAMFIKAQSRMKLWLKYAQDPVLLADDYFLKTMVPYDMDQFTYPCARKHIPEERYKRRTGEYEVGDVKPSTGKLLGLCPLYKYCWHTELEAAGHDPDNLPTELRTTMEDDRAKFATSDKTVVE